MKKLIAAASALALTAGLAFGETHETLKAHTLSTSVGDISFGAWGRSTFNVGRKWTSTKITADLTSTGQTAVTYGTPALAAYNNATDHSAYSTLGVTDKVELSADASNLETYATQVGTYAAAKLGAAAQANPTGTEAQEIGAAAAAAGVNVADTAALAAFTQEYCKQYGTKIGQAAAGAVIAQMLKSKEEDESSTRNYMGLAPDWSYGSRVGFWIIGRTPDQHFGFDFNLDADARALFVHKLYDADEDSADVNYNKDGKYAVAIGDQAKIWGLFDNPLFQTKVAFGRMREQELRGTIGDFGQRESSDVKSEDDIFQEIWTATGLFLSTKGNEDSALNGFYANATIDLAGVIGLTKDSNGNIVSKNENAGDKDSGQEVGMYDGFRTLQTGVGYTLPGLFQVKAQYWGDSIAASNYRYEASKYQKARAAGFGMNDYYGRMEFGIDWLGFMGGATSFLDPKLDLEKTPNANLIELGFKVPIVTDSDLRDYDPETFYNWYSCLGTMGVIEKGFIMYKGHLWGGMGTSNLSQYSFGLVDMNKGDGANIVMAGFDFLTEVCINPFGKQDVFVGLSGNYNITSANADGGMKSGLSVADLKLRQHKIAAEIYVKKTFASNNFMFAGIAGNFVFQNMDGTVNDIVDLSYRGSTKKFYMPIGVEMFF